MITNILKIANLLVATSPQIYSVLSVTLIAISDGMQYGWTAPVIPVLSRPDSPVTLTGRDNVWLESIYMYGGLAGLPLTIYCVDKIGRRNSVVLASIFSLTAWILMAVANRVEYLYVARFLTGISSDVVFVAAPIYIAEIAEKEIRGFLSGLIYIMMLIGILVIYSVAPFAKFYVPSVIAVVLLILQLISLPFIPMSPFYLLSKGKDEDAKKHLRKLRKRMDVEQEFTEIAEAVKRQRREKGSPVDLFKSKSNRKAMIIMVVLNTAQHFTSITVMLMNVHEILIAGGSRSLNPNTAGIIFAAILLMSGILGDILVDKFGRKSLLISSSLLTGLSLLSLAAYFTAKSNGVDTDGISWIPVACVMIYAAAFKFGVGMVPIIMTAELFPAKVKAMGITFSDLAYVIAGVLSIELYQFLVSSGGYDTPFYFFGASCLMTAAFSYWYIPETKGKSLEEIQFMLKGETYSHGSCPTLKLDEIGNGDKGYIQKV